jgi:hypothetical protein
MELDYIGKDGYTLDNLQTSAKSNGKASYLCYYHCIIVLLRTLTLQDVTHCTTCDFINIYLTNVTMCFNNNAKFYIQWVKNYCL